MIIQHLRIISTIRNLCKLVIALHVLVYLTLLQFYKDWFIEAFAKNNIQIVGLMCNNLYITFQFSVKREPCYHNSVAICYSACYSHWRECAWRDMVMNVYFKHGNHWCQTIQVKPIEMLLSLKLWPTTLFVYSAQVWSARRRLL